MGAGLAGGPLMLDDEDDVAAVVDKHGGKLEAECSLARLRLHSGARRFPQASAEIGCGSLLEGHSMLAICSSISGVPWWPSWVEVAQVGWVSTTGHSPGALCWVLLLRCGGICCCSRLVVGGQCPEAMCPQAW